MLGFIKKCFFTAMTFFSFNEIAFNGIECNPLGTNSLECISINNQKCKITSEMIGVSTDEPVFYPYTMKINKCKDSCNTINNPYPRLRVPDIIQNINDKVFNLTSRTDETRHI